jgi:phage terminase large subunit
MAAAPVAYRPTAAERAFRPYGAIRRALHSRARELVVSGPAGTGKSRGCLEKLFLAAEKYAGMRGLIVRKTRVSLTESGLVTWEQKVVPEAHPALLGAGRAQRQSYVFGNGSVVVVGGLDRVEKLMSTEYDLIFVQEAREATEHDWEQLTTRLRNGVMPYQQILADTNPDAPSHWIKQRANRGALELLESRHEDNPTVTPAYLATLDALTGVRLKRLRYGLWVAAENLVYADWDPAVHLVDRFGIPDDWPRYRSIDFGFTNPFCCQWWATDPDGRLYRYRELYGTRRTVRAWAHAIAEQSRGERIVATVTDHDTEARLELEAHVTHAAEQCEEATRREAPSRPTGPRFTVPAQKDVTLGIEKVAGRLARAGDGEPRLFLLRDSLVERDPLLDAEKKPCCTEEELDAYVWDKAQSQRYGEVLLEQPLKRDDHGCDSMRYAVMHLDGPRAVSASLYGLRSAS